MNAESYWSEISESSEFRDAEKDGEYAALLVDNFAVWHAATSSGTRMAVAPEVILASIAALSRQRDDIAYLPPTLSEFELHRLADAADTTVDEMLQVWRWWCAVGSRVNTASHTA